MRTILVATDGSASADRALDQAIALARAFDADLVILTASQLVGDADLARFSDAEHAVIGDILESEARKIVARARAIADAKGCKNVECSFEAGDPAKVILDAAGERKADVIVVGKRGRGVLAGLLLGSVSQKLVTLASCAVMVVP